MDENQEQLPSSIQSVPRAVSNGGRLPSGKSEPPEADVWQILREVSLRLTSTLNLPEVLETIVRSAVRLAGATDSHIYLYDAEADTLTFGAAYWWDGSRRPITYTPRPHGLTATVARQGSPLIINDAASHPIYDDPQARAWSVRAIAGLPLKYADRVMGVLTVAFAWPHTFAEQELRVLELLSDQAAIAIHNARLVEELRASEEKYRSLVDNSLVGVYILQDNLIKFVNPKACQIFGYTPEEMIDRLSPLDVTAPEDRQLVEERIRQRLSGEVPFVHYEFKGIRKDGSRIHIEALGRVVQYQGHPAIQGTLHDITVRKEAEAEIHRLKEFNERIVQGMEEGILIENEEGIITFANPKIEEMLGYDRGQIIGLHWMALVPPEDLETVNAQLRLRPAGVKSQYEINLLRRDGSLLPVIVNATPLLDGEHYKGVLSAFTDITERKRTEETFHALNAAAVAVQQAQNLADVCQAVSQELGQLGFRTIIALLDEAGEKAIISHVSNITGKQSEGEALPEVRMPDFALAIESAPIVESVLRQRRALFVEDLLDEVRRMLPDSERKAAAEEYLRALDFRHSILAPLLVKGRAIGLLAVSSSLLTERDVPAVTAFANQMAVALENARLYETLRERAERLEQAYSELKKLDRMKDEFVQNISHELRTPLTFIRSYVDLMLEGMLGPITDEQRESLQIVANRTEGIIRLVGDIISLKRAEMANLELMTTSLAEIARLSVRGAEVTAEEAGLKIVLDVPDDLPLVRADPQRIYQVFDNLLGNAIKFSNAGGTITVRLRRADGFVRAEVADQGIGIPASHLDRIWERFYQVDGTSTRRFGGAGLGLAIVKRIIEAHGGTVGVESVEGKGSTFFFTVPQASVPDASAA